jgi:ribosome-associated protein
MLFEFQISNMTYLIGWVSCAKSGMMACCIYLGNLFMSPAELRDVIVKALEDIQAIDTVVLDVALMTSLTDYMIITSGRSSRHVKAIADHVIEAARKHQVKPVGVEGEQTAEWILVDLGDVIVNAMQPSVREYYQLEKLWSV